MCLVNNYDVGIVRHVSHYILLETSCSVKFDRAPEFNDNLTPS
jgi:hypothetical protein